ncbi:hypothetical protein OJ998_32780 [Solirubrobacter taibaiensis]|nr:hypothetical protein [Solirubrobacter taibaiensis]
MGGKRLLIGPIALLAFAQVSGETVTPEGPATLYDDWHGGQTDEGAPEELLTGLRVTVQPGGKAGTVRLLVNHRGTVHAGAPFTLPAEPGTYVFPAPHVLHDYREISFGIEQETGGHAIATQTRCEPEAGEDDVCNDQSVDVYRPAIGTAPPDRRTAAEVQRGRHLTIDAITEPDADRDGAGDLTEDRTNLRTSATTQRLPKGQRAFDITVENAGPRPADRPRLQASLDPSPGLGTWSPKCLSERVILPEGEVQSGAQHCQLAPIAVGERRTVRLVVPDLGRGSQRFTVKSEGQDLAPFDEFADVDFRDPLPPVGIEVEPYQQPYRGRLAVKLHAARKGTVRVQLQRGGRTYARRTVNFRRAGGRSVVLRVPNRFARAEGVATLTARSGNAIARARFEPSY